MAVEVREISRSLQLGLDLGTDTNGKPIVRRRTISGIKTDALDQDVYDVAVALYALQNHGVKEILVIDRKELLAGEEA
jgi:hypothetical protein